MQVAQIRGCGALPMRAGSEAGMLGPMALPDRAQGVDGQPPGPLPSPCPADPAAARAHLWDRRQRMHAVLGRIKPPAGAAPPLPADPDPTPAKSVAALKLDN